MQHNKIHTQGSNFDFEAMTHHILADAELPRQPSWVGQSHEQFRAKHLNNLAPGENWKTKPLIAPHSKLGANTTVSLPLASHTKIHVRLRSYWIRG